jgi:hypothetical protein
MLSQSEPRTGSKPLSVIEGAWDYESGTPARDALGRSVLQQFADFVDRRASISRADRVGCGTKVRNQR